MTTTSRSIPVDLVILMDTSVSMKDQAVALSKAASAAIDQAKGSCPSDLRVTWLGLEGTWKETQFTDTARAYLTKVASLAPTDLLSRKKGELADGGAQEDGARNIEDVTLHFDWRPGAARAIFYLTDEALDAGGDRVTPTQTAAADKAIATAKAGGVTLHTYFGTTKSRYKADLQREFARVANATGGQAFTDQDSIGGFTQVLEKVICTSQVVKEPETPTAPIVPAVTPVPAKGGTTGEVKPIPTFFSTGVDSAGTPLAAGLADSHYTLVSPPGASGGSTSIEVTNPGGLGWNGNTATSTWISTDTGGGNGTAGKYTYTLSFDLAGFDPATAQITGSIAADDSATVLLNGTQAATSPNGGYTFFTPLSITTGFQAGINTLTIEVITVGGPTGLQLSATATAAAAVAIAAPATPQATPQNSTYLDGLYVFHQGDNNNAQLWYSVLTGSGWRSDTLIPNVGINFGPSAVMFQGSLYVFHTGSGLWYDMHDGDNWTGDKHVENVGISDAPCAVEFNGKLYVFHQGGADNTQLWYSAFDGSTWAADTLVPNVRLDYSPSVVVFQEKLYCFHGGGSLWCSVFDGAAWSADTQLPNITTSYAPSAVTFQGKLYVFHQGGSTNNELWYSVFDGSAWAADTLVPDTKVSFGPNVVVSESDGKLYCFHEGGGNNNELWVNVFDGSTWSGDKHVANVGISNAPSAVYISAFIMDKAAPEPAPFVIPNADTASVGETVRVMLE